MLTYFKADERNMRWMQNRQAAPRLAIDDQIRFLWRQGKNSQEIGQIISEPECLVASRIPRILESHLSGCHTRPLGIDD